MIEMALLAENKETDNKRLATTSVFLVVGFGRRSSSVRVRQPHVINSNRTITHGDWVEREIVMA